MPVFGTNATIKLDTVIFATDFSPASHNAGLYASAVSKHFGTKLIVAHAFILLQAAREAELVTSKPSSQRLDLSHDLSMTADLLGAGDGSTQTELIAGNPCIEIPNLAAKRHPSLLILGTHGHGSIDRFLLGSTAEGILRRSAGAVLTVGPQVDILRAGTLNIRRILYATDCSAEAAHAAPAAIALSEAFGAELDVLNVLSVAQTDRPSQIGRIQEHFDHAVSELLPDGVTGVTEAHSFVSVGRPHSEILKHIEDRSIDLLVLGLRRSNHLGMQNRTSGAFPIIASSSCPVVTVALGPVSGTPNSSAIPA